MNRHVYSKLLSLILGLALAGSACRPSIDDNEPVAIASNGVVADGSITTAKLADGAVTTAKVADAAITPEKLSQAYLPLAGGTMTGALNMGGLSLTNLATPTASTDAVTKNYADTKVAGYGLDTSGIASISNGQALTWDSANSRWTPTTVVGGANATQIQGINVDNTAPTANQAFYYNNGLSKWAAGTLPVAGGGTGAVTLTSNGILYGTGTTAVAALAAMANGQIVVGRTGLAPLVATLSGDATIDNAGALTIANTSVTAAKIASGTITSTQVSATGGVSTYSVASKTANYTLTTSDNVILGDSSGGTFTLTLPTAVGAGGKTYTLKKTDASTTAITVATTSAQTIDGSSTYTLSTRYQTLQVASDGANWVNVGGKVMTNWATYSLTIGATTTAPTKGTTSIDRSMWRRVGDTMELRYDYKQTALGAAANGSGTYLFPLPSGYTIDLTKIADAATYGPAVGRCGSITWYNNGSSLIYNDLSVIVYNSSNLAIRTGDSIGENYVGSGHWGMADSSTRNFSYECRVPITGWDN